MKPPLAHYARLVATGLFGGRWKQDQKSKASTNSSKCDLFWFFILLLVFFGCSFWLYFWIVSGNDSNNFNWFVYGLLGTWVDWYTVCLALTILCFIYVTLLLLLGLLHVHWRLQLHLHVLHKVVLWLQLLCFVAFLLLFDEMWEDILGVFVLSLKATGVFLHIAAVLVITAVTWFIARWWVAVPGTRWRALALGVYTGLMLLLFTTPLFVHHYSPCILAGPLPTRPQLVAHRGAASIAPENTLLAFRLAEALDDVIALESDVTLSSDGVPYLMHDDSLRRTTDVDRVFPARANDDPSTFRMAELKLLDAGSWFLQDDPFGCVASLSDDRKQEISQQKVATLRELLELLKGSGKGFLMDTKLTASSSFPFTHNLSDIVYEDVVASGIAHEQVWWSHPASSNFSRILHSAAGDPSELQADHVTRINVHFAVMPLQKVTEYTAHNVSTNAWTVNSRWLYSMLWCAGVSSVTTDLSSTLTAHPMPAWLLDPREYLAIWLSVDLASTLTIILIFVYHGKQRKLEYNLEAIRRQASEESENISTIA